MTKIVISRELLKFYGLTESQFVEWCQNNKIKYYMATIEDKKRFFNEMGKREKK